MLTCAISRVPDPRPAPVTIIRPPAPAQRVQPALPGPPELPPASGAPDGAQWAAGFVRALAETLAGRRPCTQLARWATEEVLAELWLQARGPRQVRVRGWRVQAPRRGALEVSVHLVDEGRGRAVALRLEGAGQRWLCTALHIG